MISDPDSNWCIDDSYIGGQVTYHISNVELNVYNPGSPRIL